MPRSTSKSRKRKYQGNQWSQAKKIKGSSGNATNTEGEGSTSGSTSASHASASARKLSHTSVKPKPKDKDFNTKLDGYRILSLEILLNVLKQVACQNCSKMCLCLKEDNKRRQGCASYSVSYALAVIGSTVSILQRKLKKVSKLIRGLSMT